MIRDQINVLINLAASDNFVAEKEARLIYMIGQANGITKEEIDEMLKEPQPVGDLSHLGPGQKFEHLYHVVQLMKVDGQVFKQEIAFCEDIAEKLGYNKKVIGEISKMIYSDPAITSDRDRLKKKADKYLK